MLLATASYALPCHASNSSSSGNSTAQKLTRTSNQTSQKVATTTAAALMKTISVRANRNGGLTNDASLQKTQHHQQQQQLLSKSTLVNDNLKRCTAAAGNNATNSKNATKSSTVNAKPTASTATTTAPSSSSTLTSSSAIISLKATIPTASFLKTYTVPPTPLHRSSKARVRSCSVDSLHDEMCHFKPIRTLPLTPLKSGTHSRGFSLKAPKPRLCTSSKNCDFTAIKRVVDRENPRGKFKPTRKNDLRLSSSNIFQNMKPHLSAFVRLQPNALNDLQNLTTDFVMSPVSTKSQKKKSKTKIQKTTAATKSKKTYATSNNKTEPNAQQQHQQPQKGKTATATTAGTTMAAATTKVAAPNNKNSTNSRKRKAQTNFKPSGAASAAKRTKKVTVKTKDSNLNRQTPPLTRGRKRRLAANDAMHFSGLFV